MAGRYHKGPGLKNYLCQKAMGIKEKDYKLKSPLRATISKIGGLGFLQNEHRGGFSLTGAVLKAGIRELCLFLEDRALQGI